MNTPTNCPCCGGPLRNEFTHRETLIKICDKRIDHRFTSYSNRGDHDIIWKATLMIDRASRLEACWWFIPKEFAVYNLSTEKTPEAHYMPWFEPDFSNYRKLMEKVKTYILFS